MADDQAAAVRNARNARGSEISDWMLANAAKQKFDFESAVLANRFPNGQFGTLPWGNTTVIQQAPEQAAGAPAPAAPGLLSKLLPVVAGAALGATGAGLVGLAPGILSLFQNKTQVTTPGPIDIPVNIDWKFDPNGGAVAPK